ncbi:MAG: pilus assembly protein PilM [Candidatus Muiribacteriota bacterium]
MGLLDKITQSNSMVAVDIGRNSIKIAEIKNKTGLKFDITKYSIIPIPKDMLNINFNESLLVDKIAFKDTLSLSFKQMGITNQKCIVMVSDGNTVINWLNIKLNANETLDAAIMDKLGALFPSDITNWAYNWQVLEEKKDNFIVIAEAILDSNMKDIGEIFHQLNMWPHVLDVSCFNSVNIFHGFLMSAENAKKNISLVYIGDDSTTVMIFNTGLLKSFRIIPYGGKDFSSTIAETLGLPYEEAEIYKKNERFFLREYSEEQNKLENYNIIKNIFGEIVKGIYNSFDSYLAKFREFKIHKIILYGGGANFRNINVLLQKHLNIPVTLGSELIEVKYNGQEISSDEKNILIPALGGLIRGDL